MKNKVIRIECPNKTNNFLWRRQLPKNGITLKDYTFLFEDSTLNCDYCFVIDDLDINLSIQCPKRNIILAITEPRTVKQYNKSFLSQFGRVTSFYDIPNIENISISMPLLPWMAGSEFDFTKRNWNLDSMLTYDYFKKDVVNSELDKIVVITSNKCFTRGHKKRLNFIYELKKALGDKLDIYGVGFEPVADKYKVMKRYKYALVIENCSIENYWTEKLADTYLSECLPFYYGCPNILDYFAYGEFIPIDISNVSQTIAIMRKALETNIYRKYYSRIRYAKDKILNNYNILFQISNFVVNDCTRFDKEKQYNTIYPMKRSFIDKCKQLLYRKIYIL